MARFAGMVSEQNVSFTGIEGKNHVIASGHPNNARIRELMRETQAAFRSGDDEEGNRLWQELTDLSDIPAAIEKASAGRVTVKGEEVLFDGTVMHNAITRRILWTIQEQYDPSSYMLFLDNLMDNPSKRAVDELFGFMEACNMGISEDGHLIAYKRVRDDYMDIYSGTKRNRIGDKPSMRRNEVDENKDRTCSQGLHFCSFTYLPHFGVGNGNRIMIVEVNPRDVVSVPRDYNNAKARACLYEVIGEYEGADIGDILSAKPVWKNDETRSTFNADNVRPDSSSVLDRLIRAINEEEGTELELDADTELRDIPFGLRNKLHMIISDEFDIELFNETFDDDDATLSSLVEAIIEEGGELDEERGLDEDENDYPDTPERQTTLERLLDLINDDTLDQESIMNDIDFSNRSTLAQRIEDEFGVDLTDVIVENEVTVVELADRIDNATLDEAVERNAPYISGLMAEADDDRSQSGEGASVPPVPVIDMSSKQVITISAVQTGNTTRWEADCPNCNDGKGWSQSYGRKRDARRAVNRLFGDNDDVVIIERD